VPDDKVTRVNDGEPQACPSAGSTAHETAAASHARRWYRKDHFVNQVSAERAYFRVLAESLERGCVIEKLQTRIARKRRQAKNLRAALRAQSPVAGRGTDAGPQVTSPAPENTESPLAIDYSTPLRAPEVERVDGGPISLNAEQERAVKEWAADDRLWTTQETVEFNLRTFGRVILRALSGRPTTSEENGRCQAEIDISPKEIHV
jgi:predicted DNA-binding ribbon-helix-helix protein